MATDRSRREPMPHAERTLGEIGLMQFAPYLMNRIMGRYNSDMRAALRAQNLTTAKMRTLALLNVVPGVTINELSVYAVTEQSTMSRTLEAMETVGLIRREARQGDARVREIHLTAAGRAEFDAAWPTMFASSEAMFADIDDAERAAFVATLQKILHNVRRHNI